jgi:hypothetical protein
MIIISEAVNMKYINGKWKLSISEKITMLFDILNCRGLNQEEAEELSRLTGLSYTCKNLKF